MRTLSVARRPIRRVARGVALPGIGVSAFITWSNYQSETIRVQNLNSIPDAQFNAMANWIFFDASTFNLADGDAMNAAVSAETMSIADLETYAATYVIT